MQRLVHAAVSALVVVCALGGCTHAGRALKPVAPGATAPPTTVVTSSTSAPSQPGAGSIGATGLALSSSAFAPNGLMPVELSCDGTNVSPSLEWTGVPDGAVELAVTVTDPEAKGFVHWVLAGLPASVRALAPGAVPEGAAEATNGKGTTGWTGPCPPAGPAHHYVFTLYALSAASGVTDGMAAAEAIVKITSAPVLATANLVGQYQRQ
jgi:Raf kinase inhibitor-like YbhB/YbcL family protein